MADIVRIKATPRDTTGQYINPSSLLQDHEIAYHGMEQALYIGDGGQYIKLCQASDVGRKAGIVEEVPEDAELGEVITALNSLISALTECGLMKEE